MTDPVRAAMLLDEVIHEMDFALKAAKYEQLWDEDKIPLEAWKEDLIAAAKLLVNNL